MTVSVAASPVLLLILCSVLTLLHADSDNQVSKFSFSFCVTVRNNKTVD